MSLTAPMRRVTTWLACLALVLGGGMAAAHSAHAATTTTATTTTTSSSSATPASAGTPANNDFLTNSLLGFDSLGGKNGWIATYPSSYFGLDAFIPTSNKQHVGLFGVNVGSVNTPDLSNLPAYLMQGIAQMLWTVLRWITQLVITLASWAFSFPLLGDLLSGMGSLLTSIELAVGYNPNNVAATGLFAIALALLGGLVVWRMVVKQQIVDTVRNLALSALAIGISIGIMTSIHSGGGIVWNATCVSNNVATGILATVDTGNTVNGGTSCNPGSTSAAQAAVSNDLFKTLVVYPWVSLEFNGVSHCTDGTTSALTYSADSPNCSLNISNFGGSILSQPAHGRKYAAGRGGYVYQYLLYPPGSMARQIMYYAIAGGGSANSCSAAPAPPAVASGGAPATSLCREGTDLLKANASGQRQRDLLLAALDGNGWADSDLKDNGNLARDAGLASAGNYTTGQLESLLEQEAGWDAQLPMSAITQADQTAPSTISAADEPAAYLQSSALDAAFQRLAMTGMLGIVDLGAWIVLGGLAAMMIVTQLMVCFLCLMTPVAMLCGVMPGKGHQIFMDWLKKLGGAIFTKVWYALAMAILCGVSQLIQSQTVADLGWMGALVLQGILWWGVFLQRRKIHDMIAKVSIDGQHYGDHEPKHPYYAYTRMRRYRQMGKAIKQQSRMMENGAPKGQQDVYGDVMNRRKFDPHTPPTAGNGQPGAGETELPPTTPQQEAPQHEAPHTEAPHDEFAHPLETVAADGVEDAAQFSAEHRAHEAAEAARFAEGERGPEGLAGQDGADADLDALAHAIDRPVNVQTPKRYAGLAKSSPEVSKKLFDATNQKAVNLRRANPRILPIPGGKHASRPLTSPARRALAHRATRRGAELAETHRQALDNAKGVKHATPLAEQQAAVAYHKTQAYESRGSAQAAFESKQPQQARLMVQRARAHELAAKSAEANVARMAPVAPGNPPSGGLGGGTPPPPPVPTPNGNGNGKSGAPAGETAVPRPPVPVTAQTATAPARGSNGRTVDTVPVPPAPSAPAAPAPARSGGSNGSNGGSPSRRSWGRTPSPAGPQSVPPPPISRPAPSTPPGRGLLVDPPEDDRSAGNNGRG